METLDKGLTKEKLANYVRIKGGQNRASNTLKGVSSATISQVLNDKWGLISDEMWRNINNQINNVDKHNGWQIVDTTHKLIFEQLLDDARINSNVFAVVADAGSGKTATAKVYADKNPRSYLVCCNEYYNRKMFMLELLSAMGRDSGGMTVGEMMMTICSALQKQEKPLIILDEADKLSDQVLYFFITLYNKLEDHCGIVLCATQHLEKRILRGVANNKKGYAEIYSRIGRKFVKIKQSARKDVEAICTANGITDELEITEIFNESEGDLRRVKRKIHALKLGR